jgi:hypothetical protein
MQKKTRGSKKQKKVYMTQQEFLQDFQKSSVGDAIISSSFTIFSDGYALIGDLAFVPTGTWANALRARTIIMEDYEMGIIMSKIDKAVSDGIIDKVELFNVDKLKGFLTEEEIYLMSRRVDKFGNVWTIPKLPKFPLVSKETLNVTSPPTLVSDVTAVFVLLVIVSFTAYPDPGALIATAVTIPPDVVRSTVNPVPEPDAVVATPEALLNPVPPDKLPELRAVTVLIAEAAVTVIVQLLAEVAPFKLAPGITMVSFCKYPLPAEAVVALYPGLLDMLNVAPTPLPLVVPETAENVAFVPTMALVSGPLRVTVLPVMSVTRTA